MMHWSDSTKVNSYLILSGKMLQISIMKLSDTKRILKGGKGNVTNIDLQNVEQC